eukprot:12733731-Alexandrium_andersonii.AAC.1
MSASLVGSEMCIRDSCTRRCQSTGGGVYPLPWRARLPRPPLSGERPAAVSYTHLTLPTICSV